MKIQLVLVSLCLMTAPAFAGPEGSKDHDHTPPKVSKTFEGMKELVGTWEGKTQMGGKDMPVTVSYALTSGGSALIETMGPGTPHEMITVYANRGDSVNATHYCMLGNQPVMKLKKASAGEFVFEMDGTNGISNKNEMHMHAVTLSVTGNKLKQNWTSFKGGKKSEEAVFEFTKKK